MKGNKGEWSEIYVLLKLLSEGKLYAGDDNLNILKNQYFPVIRILRTEEKNRNKNEFVFDDKIQIFVNGEKKREMDKSMFKEEGKFLLKQIKDKNNSGAFEISRIEKFLNSIYCYKIKEPSIKKADIILDIQDIHTGYKLETGFSIKSELGNPPTLLNAGKTTNFIYSVECDNTFNVEETNAIYLERKGKKHVDVKKRLKNISDLNASLEYCDMENKVFKNNLILIDSYMDKIIAQTLLYFYRDGISNCSDMVQRLKEDNPLRYGNIGSYEYKFKKFLSAIALGMKPATEWDGIDEANGGYIIVTKQGDVVAFHIYNRDFFENYLLKNTKYEVASTTRHDFGKVYSENYKNYIKLNLQIRFLK